MSATLPEPGSRTLAGVLFERAAMGGSSPFVFYHHETIGYAAMAERVVAFARGLVALGVQPGDRVGVLFENRPEWLVATLSASHIGAVVVPLNTWYKESELRWTISHCGITLVISVGTFLKQDFGALLAKLHTAGELDQLVVAGAAPVGALGWDDVVARGSEVTAERLSAQAEKASSGGDVAFILYTSGTSAEPKGVQLVHGDMIENAFRIGARRGITPDDRVWLGAPLFYGLGATNALPMTMTHGASLVLHDFFSAERALDAIESHAATVYYGTGNMTAAILESPAFDRGRVASLTKGTAGLTAEYRRMTIEGLGVSGATPAYGLTETYGHVTGGWPDDTIDVRLSTDGEALPGVELAIVDPVSYVALPSGAVGRILVRGRVTPGYYGNPEETAKAMRAGGWFDTGDLGRLDEHGRLVFSSRIKDVVKIGGINVSPLEVAQLLTSHPQVAEAHVVGLAGGTAEPTLVAFAAVRTALTEDELRGYVRSVAASFKVPARVLLYDELPRLASGKVAERQLLQDAQRDIRL